MSLPGRLVLFPLVYFFFRDKVYMDTFEVVIETFQVVGSNELVHSHPFLLGCPLYSFIGKATLNKPAARYGAPDAESFAVGVFQIYDHREHILPLYQGIVNPLTTNHFCVIVFVQAGRKGFASSFLLAWRFLAGVNEAQVSISTWASPGEFVLTSLLQKRRDKWVERLE